MEVFSSPDDTRFAQIFSQHSGRFVAKWDQYLPVYDDYIGGALEIFGPSLKLLEIGVFDGGSLEL
ncbi:O-methyltransferase I [Afipia carboxidovorans OM5]|nr:O-methyltransferase I [Afipia carboxidovorans OM5]